MNEHESFLNLMYEKQTLRAERELTSFVAAVMKLYGPEQARLSAEDWLEESEAIDSSSLSPEINWRAVTIVASARLATRLNIPRIRKIFQSRAPDTAIDTIV